MDGGDTDKALHYTPHTNTGQVLPIHGFCKIFSMFTWPHHFCRFASFRFMLSVSWSEGGLRSGDYKGSSLSSSCSIILLEAPIRGWSAAVLKQTEAFKGWLIHNKGLKMWKENHTPHHYTSSSSLDCWHKAGWVHWSMLLTLNADPSSAAKAEIHIEQTRLF